jgi:transposase
MNPERLDRPLPTYLAEIRRLVRWSPIAYIEVRLLGRTSSLKIVRKEVLRHWLVTLPYMRRAYLTDLSDAECSYLEPHSPAPKPLVALDCTTSARFEGSTTRELFEAYLEHVLAPTLGAGQMVVMDNLSAHKGGRVKEIIEGKGCELVYLPPYSPDFNPIEQAFSKVKGLLRKTQARTREALIEAMGRALDAVTVRDVRAFFAHCGYRPLDQLP